MLFDLLLFAFLAFHTFSGFCESVESVDSVESGESVDSVDFAVFVVFAVFGDFGVFSDFSDFSNFSDFSDFGISTQQAAALTSRGSSTTCYTVAVPAPTMVSQHQCQHAAALTSSRIRRQSAGSAAARLSRACASTVFCSPPHEPAAAVGYTRHLPAQYL